jgi:hypothetical protein
MLLRAGAADKFPLPPSPVMVRAQQDAQTHHMYHLVSFTVTKLVARLWNTTKRPSALIACPYQRPRRLTIARLRSKLVACVTNVVVPNWRSRTKHVAGSRWCHSSLSNRVATLENATKTSVRR